MQERLLSVGLFIFLARCFIEKNFKFCSVGWQLGKGSAGGRGGRWEGLEGVNEEAVGAGEWVDGTLMKGKPRQCLFNKPPLKNRKSTCMSCATEPFLSALPNTHSILSSFLSVHLL